MPAGTRSDPRKLVRLGLWPTTSRFSRLRESLEEFLELFEGGVGGEGVGVEDVGLVAGLGADQRGGLQAALERAGDDEVELDFMALRTWASCRQWRLPSLSRGRLTSRSGLARRVPALAWRRMKRFIRLQSVYCKGFPGDF